VCSIQNSSRVFRAGHTAQSVARSGQNSIAQGSGIWRGSLQCDLCPEGGHRTQPRVSTLGTLKISAFALKGREADQLNFAPIAAQKIESAIETCYNLKPIFALLVRSICRPFRARRPWSRFPGLKPWAESSSPFGAKTFRGDFLQMSKLQTQGKPWAKLSGPFGAGSPGRMNDATSHDHANCPTLHPVTNRHEDK
jgi:hypothetical protein